LRKIYSIAIAVLLVTATLSFGQSTNVLPTSFGPAPVLDVQSTGNGNPNSVFDVNSRGFVYLSTTTHQMAKQFMGNTTITNIGSPQTYGFPGAFARHTNGTIYVNDQLAPYGLYTLDTATGAKTLVVNITGITLTNLTGITWDGTQMWGVQSSITASQIGTINLTTGAFTPVGSSSTACAGAIMLNAAPNGTLWSVDIVADALFTWNKTTGVPTNKGALGVNANYGQDGHFDWSDGKYYWASYTTGPQLRIIDTTNGTSVQVGANYSGQISCLAVKPYQTLPPPLTYPVVGCNYGTMPAYSTGAFAHASAILGDTLYVTGGSAAGSGSTTVQRYAVNSGVFSLGTVLPESKAGHSLVKAGTSLYLIGGGATVSTSGTTCYKYTPATGWTTIAPLPVGLSGHVAVNWGDSVIFVVGGPWASPTTNIYFYRVATNTWGTSTACLAGRRSAAIGIVGNKIIIAAGYNAAFFKNTQIGTIGSNASTITWAAGPDVPLPGAAVGSSRPGGTGVGTKFYFVPGELSGYTSNTSDSIRVFNALTNTWESTVIYGRGVSGSASNYWSAVTNWTSPSGKVKVFITGGALGTVFPGLCAAQVDPCTITNIGTVETPVNYSLSQNYPNPFNPTTKISYALPKSGLVTLKVYDILGKEVATLVNEVKNVGSYTVDFSGSNLSSGVYFYKLSVGDFSSIKKMTLIK
jgi:hypothetical protein